MHRTPLVLLALLAGTATAQVGTPPPAKRQPMQEPVFTPEPPMSDTQVRREAQERVAKLLREQMFDSLIQRDENGRILPLKQRVDVAALMSYPRQPEDPSALKTHELMAYPRFTNDQVEQIQVALEDRQLVNEEILIANLDIYEQLTGGFIDSLVVFDRQAMFEARELTDKLRRETDAIQDMLDYGIISEAQANFCKEMAKRYLSAYRNEKLEAGTNADGTRGEAMIALTREYMYDQIGESTIAYENLLLLASESLPELAQALALDADTTERFENAAAAMPELDRTQRLAAVRRLIAPLPLHQRQDFLRETQSIRGF